MNTFNAHSTEPQFDDDDEFGDVESRPLFGWLLMAVALVAMAFLVGAGPHATAGSFTAPAQPEVTAPAPAPLVTADEANKARHAGQAVGLAGPAGVAGVAGLAYGG